MQARKLQLLFAYAALILIPCPSLRPFESSLAYGDLCLVVAALLNFDRALRLQSFQIPLLLSCPFIVATQVFDADGTPVAVAQAAYLFGFVLPFGWVAFASLPVHRVVGVYLAAQGLSSVVAILQTFNLMDTIGKSRVVWGTQDATRAAGLNISCSALCMNLSSLYCLLLYLRGRVSRVILMVLLTMGLIATMAKSTIFAIPAFLFYLYWEPHRKRVIALIALVVVTAGVVIGSSNSLQTRIGYVLDNISRRVDKTDHSLWERTSTLMVAVELIPECYVFGLGYEGTGTYLSQHLGNTVHVYHIGLILIGGAVGAAFHYWGVISMCAAALRTHQLPLAVLIGTHCLSVCTMPVQMLTYQYAPYLLVATILHAQQKSIAVAMRKEPKSSASRMDRLLKSQRPKAAA